MATVETNGTHGSRAGQWSRTSDQFRSRLAPTKLQRPHWSYSQLAQYLRCPLQYYFERILQLKRPFITSKLVFGSVLHEVLAAYHRNIQLGCHISIDKAQRFFQLLWQLREAGELIQYSGEKKEQLHDQAMHLIDLYFNQRPPTDVIGVEQTFVVPIKTSSGEFLEKPLVAIVDLLTRESGQLTVTEFKTSGRQYSENGTDRELQAACYKHAIEERYDEPASVQYKVLVRTQKPSLQTLDIAPESLDSGRLGDLAQAVDRAISTHIFYPVQSVMNCSGCSFYTPCREWPVSPRATDSDT